MSQCDQDLYLLARQVRQAGFEKEADRIMVLSNNSRMVVDIMKSVFTPALGPFLGQERANNLSMAVLYYEAGDTDIHEYIHDGLMKTNESFYDAERKSKISDRKAWELSRKAVQKLQKKRLLPEDVN